tara:strand:- start:1107 stop:1250 length:144 start_codon:yes stop_codon:yes gene_type:complete
MATQTMEAAGPAISILFALAAWEYIRVLRKKCKAHAKTVNARTLWNC